MPRDTQAKGVDNAHKKKPTCGYMFKLTNNQKVVNPNNELASNITFR